MTIAKGKKLNPNEPQDEVIEWGKGIDNMFNELVNDIMSGGYDVIDYELDDYTQEVIGRPEHVDSDKAQEELDKKFGVIKYLYQTYSPFYLLKGEIKKKVAHLFEDLLDTSPETMPLDLQTERAKLILTRGWDKGYFTIDENKKLVKTEKFGSKKNCYHYFIGRTYGWEVLRYTKNDENSNRQSAIRKPAKMPVTSIKEYFHIREINSAMQNAHSRGRRPWMNVLDDIIDGN